jgi:hypothetical protein
MYIFNVKQRSANLRNQQEFYVDKQKQFCKVLRYCGNNGVWVSIGLICDERDSNPGPCEIVDRYVQ